ncbi:MAG: Fpg/Nei family DNA glycosylase [Candidatus Bathyarchaeota archaeon]|nr:MAG: Fpg/Nei family DNA glycosylase [Candidatus Bathyarchaeota archaeon]
MELPELTILGRQMNEEISGKKVSSVEVSNPKCLNVSLESFRQNIIGKAVTSIESLGKWLFFKLDSGGTVLFNPGMGADVIHFKESSKLPAKYQVKFSFDDGTGFTIRVWWFCYLHFVPRNKLGEHKRVGKLGISPLEKSFTLDYFKRLLGKKKGNIKSFMLDQKNIAGIGNVYIQDMLFNAKVHPKRKIPTLTEEEVCTLHQSMKSVLTKSVELGGLEYEKDFYGHKGGYGAAHFKIGYKPGKPCPRCNTLIEKIKTGSTSSFICPKCQTLKTLQ